LNPFSQISPTALLLGRHDRLKSSLQMSHHIAENLQEKNLPRHKQTMTLTRRQIAVTGQQAIFHFISDFLLRSSLKIQQ